MSDLSLSQALKAYPATIFAHQEIFNNMAELFLREFNALSKLLGGGVVGRLEDVHELEGLRDNNEQYRQIAFRLFDTQEFQALFQSLGRELIQQLGLQSGYLQRKPVIRIQPPGMPSTSFHCDAWYGHSDSAISVWVPLVSKEIADSFTVASSLEVSDSLKAQILEQRVGLSEINNLVAPSCRPLGIGMGSCAIFKSTTLHGANSNQTEFSRVSFDFRISPTDQTGTKPLSNFYYVDGDGVHAEQNEGDGRSLLKAMTYSNRCLGVSAKSQLILCSGFAQSIGIDVIANESEIYELDYLPVLRHYIDSELINTIVVYGLDIFENNNTLATEIMNLCVDAEKTIIFCAEGFFVSRSEDRDKALARMEERRSSQNKKYI
ncbi:MAG: hypothetical protein ACON37_00755 [Candidatus Puniceispirillaceae bacterium]